MGRYEGPEPGRPFFRAEGGLSTGDAAKAHPPAAPLRAKLLAASGATYGVTGAASRRINRRDIDHRAYKLLRPRSRVTPRRGDFFGG